MTERVYLHVGSPKSGTTYLQRVLDHNRERLGKAGVLVVGDRHTDRVHAALVVREDPRVAGLSRRQQESWQRLVAQIRSWQGPSAVLSYELFSAATRAQVERALADLAGLDVHVVITARDFAKMAPSAWQERLKFGLTTPLGQWRPPPESAGRRREWGWRTMDPASVAKRWGAGLPPDHVHVVTVPTTRGGPDELWHRFAAACDLTARTTVDLEVGLVNESLGVAAAELLRRVNERIGPPIEGSREQARCGCATPLHTGCWPAWARADPSQRRPAERRAASRRRHRSADPSTAGYDVHGRPRRPRRPARPSGRCAGGGHRRRARSTPRSTRSCSCCSSCVSARRADPTAEAAARGWSGEARDAARPSARGRRCGRPRQAADNERRIAELEAQSTSSAPLHLRVATLQDVVTELLLPARRTATRAHQAALKAYLQGVGVSRAREHRAAGSRRRHRASPGKPSRRADPRVAIEEAVDGERSGSPVPLERQVASSSASLAPMLAAGDERGA